VGDGLFGAALAGLLGADLFSPSPALGASSATVHDLKPRTPHFEAKATAVIQLFMSGGPSQVDLFDPKPSLGKYAGQIPKGFLDEVESVSEAGGLMPSPFKFAKHGQSGIEISDTLPHLATCVDDMCLIRSMWTEHTAHEPAIFMMHTGRALPGFPCMGAWVAYGLGTENQNLPAYVVLDDIKAQILLGIQNWQSGWLPPVYQGTRFRSEGPPVVNRSWTSPALCSVGSTWPTRVSEPQTRIWALASPVMSWQLGCKSLPATLWTSRRNRRRFRRCMASTTR
jgi:hypothetical protein